ncbi:lipopolysaccharide biosynthesis protein [[Pasteurella] aerogenes]|nr:lipopolysaccharide biosynthesis protein [[Pasteurella] aerogenes]
MLRNKNILFISVKFFNYEKHIKNELLSLGAKVDWFDERPSNTFLSKVIIRLKKGFYSAKINKYYNEIIDKIKHKQYDYFFLIKGEVVPAFFLEFLKKNNPNINLIYYTWDSFANNKNALTNLVYFDKKFTFDSADAKKYNIAFRPLFFINDYAGLEHIEPLQYDIAFIGTSHSDRYSISEKCHDWCNKHQCRMYTFYYSPSRILFWLKRLFDVNFKQFDPKKISFQGLSHQDIIDIYKNSKCILDINHPNQAGLTMRTFEVLGAGKKLITTNKEILKYPFYNMSNIFILDRNKPEVDEIFLNSPSSQIDQEVFFSMSIRGWVLELFIGEPEKVWRNVLCH